MNERETESVLALLNLPLRALEMLTFVSRHLPPPDFEGLMASIGTPDQDLRSALARPSKRPEHLSDVKDVLEAASDAALQVFAGLREATHDAGDVRGAYGSLRFLPKGLEALYPLAGVLPAVSMFLLVPSLRTDGALQDVFLRSPAHADTGVQRSPSSWNGGPWLVLRTRRDVFIRR
jgi:phospholipase/carboxylesterase